MFLLPFIGITFGSLILIKLGALIVWAGILVLLLKLALAAIVFLAGLLGWKHIKKP